MLASELAALYGRDIARVVVELRAFPDTASIWTTAPGVSNAAGTLALHLEGNLRYFIGLQLGRIAFVRDRPLEFAARGVEQADLVARLEAVGEMVPRVIGTLGPAQFVAAFPEKYMDKPISTQQLLVHLLGHLNYHLGQIDYLRRFVSGHGAVDLPNL